MREDLVLRIAVIAAVTAAMVVLAPTRANAQPSGSITVIYNHEGSGAEKGAWHLFFKSMTLGPNARL